jgi:hypothetical protein
MQYFIIFSLILVNIVTCQVPPVANWSIGHYIIHNNQSIDFALNIYSPTKPGNYPVIIFFSGYDGLIPVFMYSDFLTDLVNNSQHILIGFDRLKYPSFPIKEENLFESTLNWTLSNLNGLFDSDETPKYVRGLVRPLIDSNGLTLMSHSAAGHPVCMYLTRLCGYFKKLILIDPVDGYDPFGIVKLFCTSPPSQLPFQIPTLILVNELDSVPVDIFHYGCAPVKVSNNRFYESLSGPSWYLNFTSYGHTDFLNDFWREIFGKTQCKSCDKVKEAICDFPTYRRNFAAAIETFIKGIDEKNQTLINALQDPQNSVIFDKNITIQSKFKLNGFNLTYTGPYCYHN